MNIKYLSKIDIRNEWDAAKKNNKINFANLSRDIFYKLYNLKFDNISCIDRDDIEYSKQYILILMICLHYLYQIYFLSSIHR